MKFVTKKEIEEFKNQPSGESFKRLIGTLELANEVIKSVASLDYMLHDQKDFWMNRKHKECAETLANDTKLCREYLEKINYEST